MRCPNCGQPCEEGMSVCLQCGSPLPLRSEQPSLAPPSAPSPTVGPSTTPPKPASSALAKASLGLGIAGFVSLVLAVLFVFATSFLLLGQLSPDLLEELQYAPPEQIAGFMQDSPQLVALILVAAGCSLLSDLVALLGLIFGVVGLTQERSLPTQRGRTHSVVGIALSSLPLFCCVAYLTVVLIAETGV